MKKLLIYLSLHLSMLWAIAQPYEMLADKLHANSAAGSIINLEVSYLKTTHIIFPTAIVSIDRGSEDILAQKAQGVDNVLKVKAGTKGFEESSLSVITTGNRLYTFLVNYVDTPAYVSMNVSLNTGYPISDSVLFVGAPVTTNPLLYTGSPETNITLNQLAQDAKLAKPNIHGLHDANSGVSLLLDGLYIHENTLFTRIQLKNTTNINYDVEQFRFYIKDKKRGKRTATQELEIKPLLINGDTTTIRGDGKATWIISLPKFTIPDGKHLIVEIMEKDGGRHLGLKIKNRKLIKARTI